MSTTNVNVDQLVADDSFRAWTEGRAGRDEKKKWDQWVRQSAKNRRLARRAQAEIIGFSFKTLATNHTSEAWDRLQRGMADYGWSQRLPVFQRENRQPRWIYYGIAASIFIIIIAGLSGIFTYTPDAKAPVRSIQQTVQTAYGERKEITFSNGSSIILNANSTLTYRSNQPEDQAMQVTLRGEAYFATAESASTARRAFTVHTPDGKILDIGTQFVVSTREKHTRVVLKRGKVAIERSAKANSKKPVLLHPGQMATFGKTTFRDIQIKTVNPAVYTSWTTSKLLFDHTPLTAVATRLKYTFGVHTVICRDSLNKQPLSGSIKNAGLPAIVSAVAEALNTSYKIKGDTVYIGPNCP